MWIGKRAFDLVFSLVSLVILSPLLLLIACWIKMGSRGPVFFRQVRVGLNCVNFEIHKFRTMTVNAEKSGLLITVGNDQRVTRQGLFLRKYKLDELPQLIDILFGNMSFVGPRPEVPRYVDFYPEEVKKIALSIRPGLTDRASLEFKDENEILGSAKDPEQVYINQILPVKLKYHIQYAQNASFVEDIKVLFKTAQEIFFFR